MNQVNLDTWEDFEHEISNLAHERIKLKNTTDNYVSEYLFRGQSSASWTLDTTLERYAKKFLALEDYYRIVLSTKPQVETYTQSIWNIPSYFEYQKQIDGTGLLPLGEIPAYEYLIYLRHHGFPSPLLDWTRSAYVAAYFAFRDISPSETHVSIYAYCEYIAGHKSRSSNAPSITGLGANIRSHRRHFQQQSEYTVCTIYRDRKLCYAHHDAAIAENKTDQDELWKFNLPASEKRKVLQKLEQYNINAYSLFGSEESLMERLAFLHIPV